MLQVCLLLTAFGTGLLIAAGGALKDTAWEKFSWRTFARSPILATLCGAVILLLIEERGTFGFFVLFALSSAGAERLVTDLWKAKRRKMPGKFKREFLDEEMARIDNIVRALLRPAVGREEG